jgi:hypothetical protein
MSRSNPTENTPNPCQRWIEWSGSKGEFKYYDKEKKQTISIPDGFTFIMLDQLATVKGWHDASESGIYANEVWDIRQDVLVVKAFKGGVLAEGPYRSIKDKIVSVGGHFVSNVYCAIKIDGELALAAVQFKGAALNSWVQFSKENRASLYKMAVRCKGFDTGKKGKVEYRTPIFNVMEISPETDAKAIELDKTLQAYLKSYFSRTKTEQVVNPPPHDDDLYGGVPPAPQYKGKTFADMEDDIPF